MGRWGLGFLDCAFWNGKQIYGASSNCKGCLKVNSEVMGRGCPGLGGFPGWVLESPGPGPQVLMQQLGSVCSVWEGSGRGF